jgi:diguanylate cyclase (GGDEF)-like protein/PAS domain S-box-containing protein
VSAIVTGEIVTSGYVGGEKLRLQMLRVTRGVFSFAAVALIGIAATIAATYAAHEKTNDSIAESREISRLATGTLSAAVERELSLFTNRAASRSSVTAAAGTAAKLQVMIDSLVYAAKDDPDRTTEIAGIQAAQRDWLQSLKGAASDADLAGESLQSRRYAKLRERLGNFVSWENERYADRQDEQRSMRYLMNGAVFAEILVLLLCVNGLRKRLFVQASEVLRHKESLETQTERLHLQALDLERSNHELEAAVRDKEHARAYAEEQAAEQSALFTAITEIFFVIDRDGRYHKVAPANDVLLAASREELLGKQVQEVLPAPVAALALAAITKALDTNSRVDVEYPLELDGKTVWFSGTVSPLPDDRVLWVVRDVSDSKQAAEALKESEARFRYLVEQSPQSAALHSEGRFLYVNPACASLLGYPNHEQLVGAQLLRFVTRETAPRLIDSLSAMSRTSARPPACECQFRRPNDGRLLDVEVTSVQVTYNGRAGVLSILHDVTERKQLEQQLAHQAFHDPLTNLANRVLFRDRVEHALQRASNGKGSPAVLFIDLDNFKAVNDGLGHSAGDWLLIEVAARLSGCLRPADTIARLGGDEFAVLLDDAAANAASVADEILQAFKVPFSVQGTDIVVTMSIGIASVLPHQGADEVLRNADLALYRAKGEGKACAASFEPAMHVAALRRLELETELRHAIEGAGNTGRLVIHYQPIARMSTGRMFGFEALVRWEHPERGLLEPLDFISLAEETGLIVPLGRWVLSEACRQTREWELRYGPLLRGTGIGLMVGVNLSGRHLAQPEIVDDVSGILRRTSLTPSHLVLEMTESMLVHDNRATLERLHSLKALGVRLSIDDFGTGYSSLAYLERFPVDSLKMDRSFISGLDNQDSKSPLAEAVIGLGRILGLRVVAEGIETRAQWDRLRNLGCGLGQGFHISHPLSGEAFERLIATSAAEAKGLASGRFPVGLSGARRTPVTGVTATS